MQSIADHKDTYLSMRGTPPKPKQLDQDIHWLNAFQKGDIGAFREVYFSNYRSLVFFATNLLRREDETAEDIVQESFRKVWENRERFETPAHIRNFLFMVTRNACLNVLRRNLTQSHAHKEIASLSSFEEPNAELLRVQAEVIAEIYNHIDALPSHYARVIRMLYLREMKPAEVAQELGITVNAVFIQKTRALKLLRLRILDKSLITWVVFSMMFLEK